MIYAGMHLTGKPFKWFRLYLLKTQINGVITINKEVRYMFLLWEGFKSHLVQMYRDSEEEEMVTRKIYKLKQTTSAIMYMTEFQSLLV